jgi:hypothetical protein
VLHLLLTPKDEYETFMVPRVQESSNGWAEHVFIVQSKRTNLGLKEVTLWHLTDTMVHRGTHHINPDLLMPWFQLLWTLAPYDIVALSLDTIVSYRVLRGIPSHVADQQIDTLVHQGNHRMNLWPLLRLPKPTHMSTIWYYGTIHEHHRTLPCTQRWNEPCNIPTDR